MPDLKIEIRLLFFTGLAEEGNSITPFNHIGPFPKIDQRDLDLTTIISINRSRTVDDTYPMIHCQSAPWPDLCFKSFRKSDGKARGD